jgi:protein-tyrosine kinase
MLLALCNPLDGNNMSRVYRALEKAEREKQEKPRVEPPLRIYRDETVSRPEVTIPRPPEQREKKPELPAKEKPPILIPPPHSFAAEQFRKLRTEIFLKSPNPHHVILVTSSVPQEGKTLVSLNLALTIAQDKKDHPHRRRPSETQHPSSEPPRFEGTLNLPVTSDPFVRDFDEIRRGEPLGHSSRA